MRAMNAYVQDVPTADGGTVQIISGFGEATTDPEATKFAVSDMLVNSPEFAKCQNQQAKITEQRKIAAGAYELTKAAVEAKDAKNEKIHAAACSNAMSVIAVLQQELKPLVEEYEAERDRLYMENAVPFPCGTGQRRLEDSEYETLKASFDSLGEHDRLMFTGEVIPDYRDTEYWIKKDNKWEKKKIEHMGEALPKKAVLADKLTPEIQAEISAQQEAERIAAMSADDKAKAEQAALDALADEADRLDRRARIQGKAFDPIMYYNENRQAVTAKYA